MSRAIDGTRPGELSNGKVELLQLLTRRPRNHEVAAELLIALSTAETHIKNVFENLGATNRTQAVDIARWRRLLGRNGDSQRFIGFRRGSVARNP